ncbi:hypothetical protein NUSPORA_00902 [Nucleospora cyclopteri]
MFNRPEKWATAFLTVKKKKSFTLALITPYLSNKYNIVYQEIVILILVEPKIYCYKQNKLNIKSYIFSRKYKLNKLRN